MKKFNINNIFSFFKKKKKPKNTKSIYKLYKKKPKDRTLNKKRKSIKLRFNIKDKFNFIKKTYLPYSLIFFVIIIIIVISLLLSPFFKVKFIIIKKDNLTNMNIAYKAIDDIRWKSIFSIEEKDLLKRFQSYQENIENIKLNISYPKTLNIEITSFKELFNVYIWWKNYLLLENGSLIPKTNKELETLKVENTFWKNTFLDYKKVYEQKHIKKIQNILKKLKENIIWIKITSLNFYSVEREFHVEINNFTTIIFSIDDDISVDEQIKNLAIFNKDYKKINKKDIIYIDLRIKNKAFFCDRNSEYRCNLNLKNIYPKLEEKKEETWTWKIEEKKDL